MAEPARRGAPSTPGPPYAKGAAPAQMGEVRTKPGPAIVAMPGDRARPGPALHVAMAGVPTMLADTAAKRRDNRT